MNGLTTQLRMLCSNCFLAPQNRNAEILKPCCMGCELKHNAADEIERLQAALLAADERAASAVREMHLYRNFAERAAESGLRGGGE